jgi:hypothetical protein
MDQSKPGAHGAAGTPVDTYSLQTVSRERERESCVCVGVKMTEKVRK